MEHEAPRQPEITFDNISLDNAPVDKFDIQYWLMLTAARKIPDDEADQYLIEASNAAWLVDDFICGLRIIEKPMRRRYRSGQAGNDLEFEWIGWIHDAILLDDSLRHAGFGRYFPRTRHRLIRRIQYILSTKHERSLRKRNVESAETPAQTGVFAPLAGLGGCFASVASPFRERIYNFRNSYCIK